ncbi:ABC transporter substrate-binding protein [Hydrogenophaga sp.]|jgi:branched-chain amino acid transport system substrate-binding protein|uniref:ABC transporter substrate-binding protein n=1 Tax=Hydrogenophaga sp. TaxID=1904254 RepID=UPI00271D828E|nr:ABC transporter substrate-binding protein [Hydrogenophaga sp.]MDO9251582.1 ABC transporter substrate-binding protein [Hydrogenophaga sp.]MDP3325871.1 ABC transporter substrate-binding protein [Hydrogenophaga sp.]MDP3885836.1 ABC transporter substrate-binding protein [Hydrogenophaga sp.]MDZ4400298.1 ABC transporter substrate-binding protein [Hydrogenophaga sp.]
MKRQAGARWIPAFGLMALMAWSSAHAEDGVGPQQLLIGQSITLQGGKNDYGTAVLDGVETYLSQVNNQGGVAGRKVVVKVLDDDNKPAQAEANARQLITQDKVFLMFGSIEGGPSTAVMKTATELKVPFFGPMAGSPTLRTPHQPLVFPVRAEHKEEFRALLQHAKSLGTQRVAFLRSDSETGQQHLDNVRLLSQPLGLEVVADLAFKSDIDDAGIDALVKQLATSRAQVVFNHGGIGVYEKLIRKAESRNLSLQFYGVNSGSTQLAGHLGELGHGMIFAQVVPSPWERKSALTRAYQDAFKTHKPGKAFSYGSLEGYMTAQALVEALQRAGPNPTRASFVAGLKNADLQIEGLKVSYRDGAHTGLSLVDLAIVTRQGQFRH